ncbi:MAG: hypothetical protein U9R34_02175 [Nanoarchaeota archaeon]|nr:hypothetical protein [Nanoarchaeota archaeon]
MHPHKRTKLDRIDKIQLKISFILKSALFVLMVVSIVRKDLFLIFSSVIALFFTFLPSIIERNYKINIPLEFETFVTLFLFLHFALGEMQGFYHKVAWWDLMLHSSSAVMLGILGFMIIYVLFYTKEVKGNAFFIAVFSLFFALSLGAIWEIFEFTADMLFGFRMQGSGLVDTMVDLILDLIGALIAATLGYMYIIKKKKGLVHRMISRYYAFNLKN